MGLLIEASITQFDGVGLGSVREYEVTDTMPKVGEGLALLVVEQFARTILPLATRAAIMAHGVITHVGTPQEIESELSSSYLGG
mgnify:CR=1 FL=1